MRTKTQRPSCHRHRNFEAQTAAMCFMLDTIIPGLANLALTLGIGFAALGAQRLADYTFATGLLLHLTVWFDEWSTAKRAPLADRKDLLH